MLVFLGTMMGRADFQTTRHAEMDAEPPAARELKKELFPARFRAQQTRSGKCADNLGGICFPKNALLTMQMNREHLLAKPGVPHPSEILNLSKLRHRNIDSRVADQLPAQACARWSGRGGPGCLCGKRRLLQVSRPFSRAQTATAREHSSAAMIPEQRLSITRFRDAKLGAALVAAVFMLTALWLFTRQNDFAFFYHSDESAKVEQVLTRQYNFHHPMLLLTATELALAWKAASLNAQSVVETGRFVSALFAAISVGAFVLLAYLRAGWLPALATGFLLTFHQQLFELAHYMKEDPALLVGIALTFLALAWYQRQPTSLMAVGCGVACGLAISGKYVGLVALACAAPVFLRAGRLHARTRILHAVLLLTASLIVVAVANLPLLSNLAAFRASLDREVELVVEGSKGMTRRVPHAVYLNIFADNTTPVIWVLLAAYYAQFWKRRSEHDTLSWVTALFPLVLTVAFSFSPKTNDRYYLPATATFYYLAALGLRELPGMLPDRWKMNSPARRTLFAAAVLVLALSVEAPRFLDVYRAFQHDDRRDLAEWIREYVPANAVVVQDERVMLPDPRNRTRGRVVLDLPQTFVSGKRYAAELGDRSMLRKALGKPKLPTAVANTSDDFATLRAEGVTHVAVTESSYGRFFLGSLRSRAEFREEHARLRAFYERLFREGKLLFERRRGTVIYLHPGLRFYELPPQPR